MLESKEQAKIKEYMKKEGWIVINTITLSDSGYPDLFAFKNSVTLFVEVKRKGGVLSTIQKYRIKELEKQGFTVIVPYGYLDFKEKYANINIH